MNIDNTVLVSIIIPTFNNKATIEKCLTSLTRQSFSNFEVIVVDNSSKDATREIAQKYGKIYIRGPERCSQKNFGASKAKGVFLFFIDSDMELAPRVVEECVKEALNKNLDAVIIPEISVGEGFWAGCRILERSCYIKDTLFEAARFFKKETFFNVKGFDEKLIFAEDWDLSQRVKKAGYEMGRIPSHIIHHEGYLSLWNNIKKKFYYGQSLDSYKKKHPDLFVKQATIFRPAFFRHWTRLIRKPLYAIGVFFMKACEFSALALGSLLMKIRKIKGRIIN